MKISISAMEKNEAITSDVRKIIEIFLSAINDWPNQILTFEDYESEVQIFINGVTTKEKIKNTLKKIDFTKQSWQAESLTQILGVFQLFKDGISLKEIIEELGSKIESRV